MAFPNSAPDREWAHPNDPIPSSSSTNAERLLPAPSSSTFRSPENVLAHVNRWREQQASFASQTASTSSEEGLADDQSEDTARFSARDRDDEHDGPRRKRLATTPHREFPS